MSTEENKVIARRVLEEVFIKGDLSVVDELVDPGYVWHGAGGRELRGTEGMKKDAASVSVAFPDVYMTVEDQIAEGDKVVTHFTFGGTHSGSDFMGIAPSGRQFNNIRGIIISHIRKGKVVEEWEVVDQLGWMQQLGVIPPVGGGG